MWQCSRYTTRCVQCHLQRSLQPIKLLTCGALAKAQLSVALDANAFVQFTCAAHNGAHRCARRALQRRAHPQSLTDPCVKDGVTTTVCIALALAPWPHASSTSREFVCVVILCITIPAVLSPTLVIPLGRYTCPPPTSQNLFCLRDGFEMC
jgi:hypothetical protein